MNRIVYALICVCLVAVVISAFLDKVDIAHLSVTDIAITIAFMLALVAGSLTLHSSPWGSRLKSRFDASNDRARIKARDEGKVRRPPWWSLWP